ncbi:hypothetical protein OSJ57_17680 [Sphingomonas sp. HH69]
MRSGRIYKSGHDTGYVEVITHAGRMITRATCVECGTVETHEYLRAPPAEALPRKFSQKGWSAGTKAVCPQCITKKRNKTMTAVASVTPLKAAQTPDVRQQRRDAHTLIELYYDLASSTYKDRYSDEKIAKETGLPKEWVAKRREDEFGPIKEPNDLAVIRQEVATAKGVWEQAVKKLDDLCVRNGWRQ